MGKKKRRKPEIGKVKVVKDFLPPPDRLVLREEREENVKAASGSTPLIKQA